MAEPTDKQPIVETDPGYVTLSDGRRVPTMDTWFNQQANNPQGLGAAQQRTQLGQQYQSNVAQPVTDALGNFIATPTTAAEKLGLLSPETGAIGRRVGRGIASAVVPQDLTQAGIDAGIVASAGAMAPLGLGRGMQAAGRVLGGTAGGLAGGYADTGTATGAGLGAGRGLLQSGVAESAGALWDYSRTLGVDRARRKIQDIHAQETGYTIQTNPRLQGVFQGVEASKAGLEDLVHGVVIDPKTGRATPKGQALVSAKYQQADDAITSLVSAKQAQDGVTIQFPLVESSTKEKALFGSWDKAREELVRLKSAAARANPIKEYTWAGEKISGAELKQFSAETQRVVQHQLTLVDPQALKLYNDANGMYEAGQFYLSKIEKAFANKGNDKGVPVFNSDAIQRDLSKTRKSRAEGINKLGADEYWKFSQAVGITPETAGMADVYAPTGILAHGAGIIPGPIGTYARMQLGRVNPVNNPLTLGQAGRTGVTLGGAQAMGAPTQYLSDQIQGMGIPGLGR